MRPSDIVGAVRDARASGDRRSLVGREQELAAITAALDAARSGTGELLLVEGPAGIGKTSLLRAARAAAEAADLLVLRGVGTAFERDYPFGVLRQSLAPLLRDAADRARWLTGAARLAAPALLDLPEEADANPFGILNGLYWLLASLADDRPVLLCVDDAQWADEPTLRFLDFLALRLHALGVAVVVGARPPADFSTTPALASLREHARDHGRRVEPRALDLAGVALVVGAAAGGPVDDVFVAACHRSTGGNPFLLDELLRALVDAGAGWTAADAGRVAELSVPGVGQSVSATLTRLGPVPAALARAAAVLGEGTPLDLATELAGLGPDTAPAAATALREAGLLDGGPELRFRHPILAGAVRDGIPGHERADAHAQAARLLRDRGAPAERVALQLVHVPAAGDASVVGELRLAARHARERAAPAIAATLLERALAEHPDAGDRNEILLELGRAELDAGRLARAAEHFFASHDASDDPLDRGRAAALLGVAVPGAAEQRRPIVELVRRAHAEVAPLDRELALRLGSVLVLEGASPEEHEPEGRTVAEAVYLGHLVFSRMDPAARADDVVGLATRAARQADAVLEEGAIALAFTGIVLGLRWGHRLAEAQALLDRAIAVARRRGSTADFAIAMTLRANVHRNAGRLRDAEADARSALPVVLDDDWAFARGVQPLVGSLLDQGRTDDASAEMAAFVGGRDAIPDSPPMVPVLLTRMALRAARREHDEARTDWEDALRRAYRGPHAGWIEDLAVAADVHLTLGDADRARAEADRALEIARCWDTPGAIGQALLTQVRVGAADDAVETLRSAASLLGDSPLRLVHARSLVALGGRLRRDGHRADSREPLREGFALAETCGATGLAEEARVELRASGVRVRPTPLTAGETLTPSEQRIAELAAAGHTNAEIAQDLFLTVKTVEMHLTQSYRKLGIRGRRELAAALETPV